MLFVAQAENALLQLLAPVATGVATKIEILPPDYFERDAEGSALRNRHAFIAFEAKRYSQPANKGLAGGFSQQVTWAMKIVCTHKELRTHQGLYPIMEAFEQALVGTRITERTGPIYVVNYVFRKIEANSVWVADLNFEFVENINNCAKQGFLIT